MPDNDDEIFYDDPTPVQMLHERVEGISPRRAQLRPNGDNRNQNNPALRNERGRDAGNLNGGVDAEVAAPHRRQVRFDADTLRRGRSAGPAPEIPHVLPAAPERSAQMRDRLRDIHRLDDNGDDIIENVDRENDGN